MFHRMLGDSVDTTHVRSTYQDAEKYLDRNIILVEVALPIW